MEAELLIELYGNSLLTELFCCFIPMNNSVLLGALLFSVSIGVCSGLMRLTVFLFPCDFYLAIVSSDLMRCFHFLMYLLMPYSFSAYCFRIGNYNTLFVIL